MASLMNGFSAMGAGVAQFAGQAGLELQKSQLAQQQTVLADQLATTRETALQASGAGFAAAAATQEQGSRAALQDKSIASQQALATQAQGSAASLQARALAQAASEGAANRSAAAAHQQAALNADPESIKILRILGALPPAGGSAPAAATLPGPRASGGTAADGSAVPSMDGSSPSASADAQPLSPAAQALVNHTLGLPAAGSQVAARMAIAGDVASDPDFKYKTAGQKAAEIESRVAVAEGKMTAPGSRESMAKGIASYQIAPLASFALTKPGGPETMARVMELNPDFQDSRYPEVNKGMAAFGTGKQGDIVRSLNVGVQHLDVLDQAGQALANGDVRALNTLKNMFQQQFGSPEPTTFEGIKQIVGTEVEKAVAGGIGSASDRDRIMGALDKANSPAQLKAITDGFRSLMVGQLSGLKTQYEDATGFKTGPFAFDTKLVPITAKALGVHNGSASAEPPTPDWKGAADGSRFQQGGTTYIKQGNDPSKWKAAP